jgi:hypothetical protein
MKHINALCVLNAEFFNVIAGDTNLYYCIVKELLPTNHFVNCHVGFCLKNISQ